MVNLKTTSLLFVFLLIIVLLLTIPLLDLVKEIQSGTIAYSKEELRTYVEKVEQIRKEPKVLRTYFNIIMVKRLSNQAIYLISSKMESNQR